MGLWSLESWFESKPRSHSLAAIAKALARPAIEDLPFPGVMSLTTKQPFCVSLVNAAYPRFPAQGLSVVDSGLIFSSVTSSPSLHGCHFIVGGIWLEPDSQSPTGRVVFVEVSDAASLQRLGLFVIDMSSLAVI